MGSKFQSKFVNEKGYRKLLIWQKAKELVKIIYNLTSTFPNSEINNLTSQLRRAAVSIVLNIVEGHRRSVSNKEFIRFLTIADGSLTEVEACLELSLELGYISSDKYQKIELMRSELAIMLNSFLKSIKSR